jgi:hypothetical protein
VARSCLQAKKTLQWAGSEAGLQASPAQREAAQKAMPGRQVNACVRMAVGRKKKQHETHGYTGGGSARGPRGGGRGGTVMGRPPGCWGGAHGCGLVTARFTTPISVSLAARPPASTSTHSSSHSQEQALFGLMAWEAQPARYRASLLLRGRLARGRGKRRGTHHRSALLKSEQRHGEWLLFPVSKIGPKSPPIAACRYLNVLSASASLDLRALIQASAIQQRPRRAQLGGSPRAGRRLIH